MPWADVDDVLTRWAGDTSPTDRVLVETLIDDTELFVRHEVPTLDARVGTEDGLEDRARAVVSRIVIRLLRNPDGYAQVTLGDGSVQYSANREAMLLEPQERAWLAVPGTAVQRAFSINPMNADTTPVFVNGGGWFDPGWQ